MKSLPSSVACTVAALLMAATAPAYGNGSNCLFRTSGTVGLSFTLNPSVGGTVNSTASVEIGDCNGSQTMVVTVDQGLRGNRTMERVSGTETIQYSIGAVTIQGGAAGPGNNVYKIANFTGTVLPAAYLNAVAGTYSDRLVVTLTD
jgi:spore coat protein U-like protein